LGNRGTFKDTFRIFLSLLLGAWIFSACKTTTDSNQEDSNRSDSKTELQIIDEEADGPIALPIGYKIPPKLDEDKVIAQVYDIVLAKAAVIGLENAAASGIDQACAQKAGNSSAQVYCADVNSNGSFRILIDAKPGQVFSIWSEGESYDPGGPDINDILEKVQYWSQRFPSVVSAIEFTRHGMWIGGANGLYFVSNNELAKQPNEIETIKYTMAHNLPSNKISAIVAQSDDILWVGTHGGLVKITNASSQPEFESFVVNSATISSPKISSILVENDRSIWVGSLTNGLGQPGGITHISIDTNNQYHFAYISKLTHFPSNNVRCLSMESDGTLWVGTQNEGVVRIRRAQGSMSFDSFTVAEGLLSNTVSSIAIEDSNSIWIGTQTGSYMTYSQDPQDNTLDPSISDPTLEPFEPAIVEPAPSTRLVPIWIDTPGGLSHYTAGTFHNYNRFNGFPSNEVMAVQFDSNGDLWVGSGGGVTKVIVEKGGSGRTLVPDDGTAPPLNTITFNTGSGLLSYGVISIAFDPGQELWVGTYNRIHRKERSKFIPYFSTQTLPDNHIQKILRVSDNELWIATLNGLSHFFLEKGEARFKNYNSIDGMIRLDISDVAMDHLGGLWVSNQMEGTRRLLFDANGEIISNEKIAEYGISNLAVDGEGIWVGSGSQLIYFKVAKSSIQETESHELFPIQDISVDGSLVWIATSDGLYRLDKGSNSIQPFTTADGLAYPVLSSVSGDNGDAWIGSILAGAQYLQINTNGTFQFQRFWTGNGFPSNRITKVLANRKGGAWFGTEDTGAVHLEWDSNGNPTFEPFSLEQGLPSVHVLSLAQRDDHAMYFGTINGLVLGLH